MAGLEGGWVFAAVATALVALATRFVRPGAVDAGTAAGEGVDRPPPAAGRRWRIGILLALPALAAALYLRLGDPAAIDPGRERLSALLREPGAVLDAVDRQRVLDALERHLRRQGDDARAWVVKARLDLQDQRFEAAAAAYAQALRDGSRTIGDALLWVEYAEAQGLAQGGTLAGRPREWVARALAIDPDQPKALDLAGSAAWEAGEFGLAAQHWRRLLAQMPEGQPRHLQLSTAIQAADRRARLALPPPR